MFCQLAEGLLHIHWNNFLHRNIKPQNVLIDRIPNPQIPRKPFYVMKLSDFGLSRPAYERELSATGGRQTEQFNWLAPELLQLLINDDWSNRIENVKGTIKSDVFALGLVFGYFLLGGLHPFGSESSEIQTNIMSNNSVNLTSITLFNIELLYLLILLIYYFRN